jgi:tRNA pseudouridine32 synthase/23S rRNA pseudouridine746 synthase/23S rRNA pseudouridine1911/1915/1917 synthase
VVGDTRYGASASALDRDIALHHAYLRLEHPEQPRVDTFVAPIPDAWRAVADAETRSLLERELDRATLH